MSAGPDESAPISIKDRVWAQVLERLRDDGYFKITDLSGMNAFQAERTLQRMADMGYVKREEHEPGFWVGGFKARQLGIVMTRSEEVDDEDAADIPVDKFQSDAVEQNAPDN